MVRNLNYMCEAFQTLFSAKAMQWDHKDMEETKHNSRRKKQCFSHCQRVWWCHEALWNRSLNWVIMCHGLNHPNTCLISMPSSCQSVEILSCFRTAEVPPIKKTVQRWKTVAGEAKGYFPSSGTRKKDISAGVYLGLLTGVNRHDLRGD